MRSTYLALALSLLLLAPNTTPAQEIEHLQTLGGELRIVASQKEGAAMLHRVTLAGRLVFETDEATPAVHTYFKQPLYSSKNGREVFAEVVLLALQTNACEGGELLIVGIRRDGAFARADKIIPCTSRVVSWQYDRITITEQGRRPRRWVYAGGQLTAFH